MSKNPRLIRAVKGIQRRMFLKALAAGMAVPAAFRLAKMATAASGAPPKRFFLFFMPHGVAPEHYDPRLVGGDPKNFALDQTGVSILGPLQPYKQYVNVYEGFQYPGPAATHTGIVNCLSGSMATDTTWMTTNVPTRIPPKRWTSSIANFGQRRRDFFPAIVIPTATTADRST